MSARQRARLRELEQAKQRSEEQQQAQEEEEDVEESDVSSEGGGAAGGFSFLRGVSDDDDDDDDSSEEDEDEEEDEEHGNDCKKSQPVAPPKPKRKEEVVVDDDALLEEAIAKVAEKHVQDKETTSKGLNDLFALEDVRALNPDIELRKRFGDLGGGSGMGRDREASTMISRRGVRQGRQQAARRTHKAIFCTIDEQEARPPPVFASGMGGARMNLVGETDDGGVLFSFEGSESYRELNKRYKVFASSLDPNQIIAFLNESPFHAPAVLQMCEVYLRMSQLESAEMMLRSALYIFESWLHPRFADLLKQGKCRMKLDPADKSDCGLNRVFFHTLFRSMLLSERRGCVQTAFALAKVLLSFDPVEDPFFIRLVLDRMALQAKAYDYLGQLIEIDPISRELPTILYTHALCLYLEDDQTRANEAAEHALRKFPGAFTGLIQHMEKTGDKIKDEMVQSAMTICKKLEYDLPRNADRMVVSDFMGLSNIDLWKTKNNEMPRYKWLAFRATDLVGQVQQQEDEVMHDVHILHQYAKVPRSHFADDTGAVVLVDGGVDDGEGGGGMMGQGEQLVEPNVDLDAGIINLFFQTLMPWARLPPRAPPGGTQGTENDDDEQEQEQ